MSLSNVAILVADAQAPIGAKISHILNSQPTMRVVITHNYTEAERQAVQQLPSIIWFLMQPGNYDGIAEVLRLKKLSPASRIVAVVAEEDEQQAFAAIMAGVQGYCRLQEIEIHGVDSVIQMLSQEEYVLRPALRERLMRHLRATALGQHAGFEGVSGLSHQKSIPPCHSER